MGKIKPTKSITKQRASADPILGGKVSLADEIESMKTVKTKLNSSQESKQKNVQMEEAVRFGVFFLDILS
jgi:hypothetical protein